MSKSVQQFYLTIFVYLKLKITGQTGTYQENDYSDKPISRSGSKWIKKMLVSRQGNEALKKIGQKIEKVIQKAIRIAKYILNDDCELADKKDIVDMWEKTNKHVLDQVAQKLDINEQDLLENAEKQQSNQTDDDVSLKYNIPDSTDDIELNN